MTTETVCLAVRSNNNFDMLFMPLWEDNILNCFVFSRKCFVFSNGSDYLHGFVFILMTVLDIKCPS